MLVAHSRPTGGHLRVNKKCDSMVAEFAKRVMRVKWLANQIRF